MFVIEKTEESPFEAIKVSKCGEFIAKEDLKSMVREETHKLNDQRVIEKLSRNESSLDP